MGRVKGTRKGICGEAFVYMCVCTAAYLSIRSLMPWKTEKQSRLSLGTDEHNSKTLSLPPPPPTASSSSGSSLFHFSNYFPPTPTHTPSAPFFSELFPPGTSHLASKYQTPPPSRRIQVSWLPPCNQSNPPDPTPSQRWEIPGLPVPTLSSVSTLPSCVAITW